MLGKTPHLLGHAGHGGALPLQRVSLTHGEQRARQDGAELVEGAPPRRFGVLAGGEGRGDGSGKQLRQQRLVRVAVAAEGSGHAQQGGDGVPAEVLWTGGHVRG